MARSKQQARKGKSNNEEKKSNWNNNKNDNYDTIVKENALFEKYYKQLNLIEPSEFDVFLETLKKPLPITFRITSYKSFAKQVLEVLKEKHFKYLDEVMKEENADKVKEAAGNKSNSLLKEENIFKNEEIYKQLVWYPNELAWQVNLSRHDVRKNAHFEELKQFLMHQTDNGNISRQEAVSMIPPLVLDVQPHHKILDMCASPGSKTAQLIEFLHQDKSNPTPEGFVVANDLDNKRCYMLMHQLKRLESPNFMIINHDASALPNFRKEADEQGIIKNITYDRILADVPCSGDGTFRKNIDVWVKWNPAHACNLHGIQSRIATRAVELLNPGGVMVYSTCSLNPVENEAVVYNLLLKFKGQIELVDARDKLPGLKTVNGLLKWNLMDKLGEVYETSEQAANSKFNNLMRPHMFPPELEVAKELNLDKCIRVLPHHQNTGGFFIAVIRKLPLSTEESSENADAKVKEENPPEANSRVMKGPPAKRQKHSFEENPFKFNDLATNTNLLTDWPKIKEFFKISDDFPVNQMMTRNKKNENVKNVYFVSKEIKELTVNNGDRIKFINMGVPLFSKAEIKDPSNIDVRVNQESLDIVLKYFNKRIVSITNKDDLLKILSESMPSLNELSSELQKQINEQCDSQVGSFIMISKLAESVGNPDESQIISFTAWLGKSSVRPLINILARNFYLTIAGVDQNIINEACQKIKLEDKMNSEKSLKTNPQYQQKKVEESKTADNDNEEEDKVEEMGEETEAVAE